MYQINGLSLLIEQVHEKQLRLMVWATNLYDYVSLSGIEGLVPTKPPMFTIVDIVEQGRVPMMCSRQQMKIPQMQLGMRPDRVLITCEALGLHHVQATQASSSHIVIDLAAIISVPSRTLSNI